MTAGLTIGLGAFFLFGALVDKLRLAATKLLCGVRAGRHRMRNRTHWAGVLLLLAILNGVVRGEEIRGEEIAVSVDPRVELVCVVFRLAGHWEYNQARVKGYAADVDTHFAPVRDHAVVKRARDLLRTRGIAYDACMSLAIHLDDAATLGERVPFEPLPEGLDPRWTPEDARAFVDELRDFAKAGKFAEFVEAHQELYAETTRRMETLIAKDVKLAWFRDFFGDRPGASFRVAIGMLNGPMNYGTRCRLEDGSEELHAILGAGSVDREGLPAFGSEMVETLVHEFAHSYVNPIVKAHLDALRPAGEKLFAGVAEQMRRQAYGKWETMLCETLVRACVIRYLRANDRGLDALRRMAEDQFRGFRWVGRVADALKAYEKDRATYPTLDAFVPRIVEVLEREAGIGGDEQAGTGTNP